LEERPVRWSRLLLCAEDWSLPGKRESILSVEIDCRVAVGPTHYRIPIKLEYIPLPWFFLRHPKIGYNQEIFESSNWCAHFRLANESVVVKADLAKSCA